MHSAFIIHSKINTDQINTAASAPLNLQSQKKLSIPVHALFCSIAGLHKLKGLFSSKCPEQ